jgi:hypothetical protein
VLSPSDARRSRGLLTALALLAMTFGTLPLASPAASAQKPAAAKTAAAKKTAVAAKSAAKKTAPKKAVAAYRPHTGPAPADEYFGRLQMSILGVRNKVKDLSLDADLHPEHDKAILGSALWVEDAMRDWAKKYPFDRWLPRYAYALEVMYERIPSDDAHRRAVKQVSYLTAYFPQTVYGKVGRVKLARGIPKPDPSDPPVAMTELERLALLDGKVLPTIPPAATPSPSPAPVPAAPAPAAATPSAPEATASPTPAPVTTLTPAATASARPASP